MKALFQYIEAQVNARVPAIKTVRMWNNQLVHSNGSPSDRRINARDEKPFKYPAVFTEFIIDEVFNMPLGITDYLMRVRFRFALESYKYQRLDTLDFCDSFLAVVHLMAPTDASGLTFTTFQLAQPELDEDHNNVDAPYLDYRTRYRHIPSYTLRNDIEHGPITPNATGEVIEIEDL